MKTMKELAALVDCHPRTCQKWLVKLHCPPDIRGHGPNKWRETTAQKFVRLYELAFARAGTTPWLNRAKFSGKLTDKKQLTLKF